MKIKIGEREYEASLDVPKLLRVEVETQKSLQANGADPSISFICSVIAAAISSELEVFKTLWVAQKLDIGRLEFYSQVVATLLGDATKSPVDGNGNVINLKKK